MRIILLILIATVTLDVQAQLTLSQDSNEFVKFGVHYERTINYGTYVGGSLDYSYYGLGGSVVYDNYTFKTDYGSGYGFGADLLFMPFKKISLRLSPSYEHLTLSATGSGERIVTYYYLPSTETSHVTQPFLFTTSFIVIPLSIQYYFNKSKYHSFYLNAGMSINFLENDVLLGDARKNSMQPKSSVSSFLIGGIGYLHTLGTEAIFSIEPTIKDEVITKTMVRYLSLE